MNEKEFILPDGWEVKEVVDNKIIIKEKGRELPKTWGGGECNKGVFMSYYPSIGWYIPNENEAAIKALCKLLVCRNAWWKQLDWKPDWDDDTQKFCIYTRRSEIISTGIFHYQNFILAFPTQEVRDRFYESFCDLIEEAKELL